LVGTFTGDVDFGGANGKLSGGSDTLFAARLDDKGMAVFARAFVGTASHTKVAVDSAQNIVFAGDFAGTLDLDGSALTSKGQHDLFVAKLDATGMNVVFKASYGGSGDEQLGGLAVTSSMIAIAGGFDSPQVDFSTGENALSTTGGTDV